MALTFALRLVYQWHSAYSLTEPVGSHGSYSIVLRLVHQYHSGMVIVS